MSEEDNTKAVAIESSLGGEVIAPNDLVIRSSVPEGLDYPKYRPFLRHDFFHSCAYCTTTESEARAIRFTIDHYEPRSSKPELANQYDNLMYCCDECNTRKGDRIPPPKAREDGVRFFRPDQDVFSDHFFLGMSGIVIDSNTKIGNFTIDAIDLNRHALKRIRDIRLRLCECDKFIAEGVRALRSYHIDHIHPDIRAKAIQAIKRTVEMAGELANHIDDLLREYAKSELIDEDMSSDARYKDRSARLKNLEKLYPGDWRAPKKQKPNRKKKTA